MKFSWILQCFSLIAITLAPIQIIPTLYDFDPIDQETDYTKLDLPVPSQDIGDNRSFWAVDYDEDVYYVIDAYLLAIGNYCYIYIEDSVITILGEEEAADRAELYKNEFDINIYPRVTDIAGDPNGTLGDIDGDPRIYILIMENRWSCYRQTNEIEAPYSNMCEMVYICYRTNNVLNCITHEFHHLVWFNYEFDEVHFILEGLAEYATYYAGYIPEHNKSARVSYFLNDPNNSLIYFDIEPEDYGASYLLAFYLAEQYGEQFLRDLVQHEDDGALGLETALKDAGHNISFNDLYMDWMTALAIDEESFEDDRYCLRNIDATIQDYTTIDSIPYQNDNVPLYCYGSKIFKIQSPPDKFSIEITQQADGIVGLSIAYRDAYGWHVQQMKKQGHVILNVSGDSIVIAHIVVSYMFAETPSGNIDFGSGNQETVQILVYDRDKVPSSPMPTTSTPIIIPINNYQFFIIVVGGTSLTVIFSVLVLFLRRRNQNR